MKPSAKFALQRLRDYESRNVTFMEADGSWPIVWDRARGVQVWDVEGRRYLDLTAAFGVAAAGHAHPAVVRAGQKQMARLLHAMGDVHPHALKGELARELSRLTYERWSSPHRPQKKGRPSPTARIRGKTVFCNSGFEAVEAALKTAVLATEKPDVIVFEGAYHGLGYGALNATHRDFFQRPFRSQLRRFGHFAPFPRADLNHEPRRTLAQLEERLRALFRRHSIGAILVEPVQVRGGVNIPPPGFLPLLRNLAHEFAALLILDEIYTGFGRTGKWFACEHSGVIPDVVCLGKALTGGFPLSACVGRAELMDRAWPASTGEALHTSTFLGHPVGCAMALAQIKVLQTARLPDRAAKLGPKLLGWLSELQPSDARWRFAARGVGLIAGLEILSADGRPATAFALEAVKTMLHRGFILLPEGEHSNILGFTPPLTITETQLRSTVAALRDVLS